MMANKVTFQKLTEDIEKLNKEETVEKSEGLQNAEFIEPAKEEPEKEPEKKEEDEPEVKPEEDKEPEAKKEEEPEAVEPEKKPEDEETEQVEKSKGDKEEAAEEDKDAKAKKAAKNKDKKKEDEKVEKSEDSEDISGDLIVKAFEELTKSNQSTNSRLNAIEKSLAAFFEAFQADKLEKSKEEDKKEEEDKDEQKSPDEPLLAEDIEKSVKVEEEAPEGKAVEYVQKSADGVAVPEETPEKEEEVEQPEKEPEFNPRDHVSTVVDYYTKNASNINRGQQNEFKYAVQRVKRGAATEADVELFKEIVESSKK